MPKKKVKKATRVRSAKSGRFAPKAAAKRSPGSTITETVKARRDWIGARDGLSFPGAMTAVIAGHAVRRRAWAKTGRSDAIVLRSFGLGWREIDGISFMSVRDDILATDWEIA